MNTSEKVYRSILGLFFTLISPILVGLQRFISPLILIRVGKIYNHRLGHFILEYDWYHANENKKIRGRKHKFPVYFDLFFLSSSSSNYYFEQVVRNSLNVIPREIILGTYLLNRFITKSKKYLVNFPIRPTDLSYLDCTPPSHILSDSENELGGNELAKLGLNPNQGIVCFFIRDTSYEKNFFPDSDNSSTEYRNSRASSFEKSMEFLANKGFIVIRMGKTAEKFLEVKHPNIIDYPFSTIKSDFMDFYLSSKCKFAIATDSGAMMLPILFRKPLFLANVPGFHGLLQGKCVTLFQFKTFIDLDSGNELNLQDLLQRNFAIIDSSDRFEASKIRHLENTSDEILNSTIELVNILESNSNLIRTYHRSQQLLNSRLKSSISKEITALLSSSWIKNHPKFLD
jgi:putative glycosyltransferase (TIGR04372 family)